MNRLERYFDEWPALTVAATTAAIIIPLGAWVIGVGFLTDYVENRTSMAWGFATMAACFLVTGFGLALAVDLWRRRP